MDYTKAITTAAKLLKVSSHLLLAVCQHESGLKNTINYYDKGSESFGICQTKRSTALQMGFSGNLKELMNPDKNALIAAHYLKFQQDRYNGDLVKAVAAYNSGTYRESKKMPNCPMNLKYVKSVRSHLPEDLQPMLMCERWADEMKGKVKNKKYKKHE